jgi:hypothetical protein
VFAHLETLKNEVVALKETVRARDESLSGTGREIKTLRAIVHDRDKALQAAEKAHGELRDQIMGWQTHVEGKFSPNSDLSLGFLYVFFADLILRFRAREATTRGPDHDHLISSPPRGRG